MRCGEDKTDMKSEKGITENSTRECKIKYIVGIIMSLLVIGVILFVLLKLVKPEESAISLIETKSESHDWSFEILDDQGNRDIQPGFEEEYIMDFGSETAKAIRAKRIMTEELEYASLRFYPYSGVGIEVFFDGEIAYSDFQTNERDEDGYLILGEEERNKSYLLDTAGRQVRVSLPVDYRGMELTIITYFSDSAFQISPEFPLLGNDETDWGLPVADVVFPIVELTICAILAILLCGILVGGIKRGQADYRVYLLILFFLLWFLDKACMSLVGSYSGMDQSFLSVLQGLYVTPVVMYVALGLNGWKKYVLFICSAIQFACDAGRQFINWKSSDFITLGENGQTMILLLVLLVILSAIEYFPYKKIWKKYARWENILLLASVCIGCVMLYSMETEGNVMQYFINVWFGMRMGNFVPVVQLVTSVISAMIIFLLIIKMAKTTVRMQQTVNVLAEREHFAMENLEIQRQSEEKTRAFRHEMNHHMAAVSTFLKENDIKRAQEYIGVITKELNDLPKGSYSTNSMINAIVGRYFEKTKQAGIRVQHRISVPEKLAIEDRDLCVLLNNMLENAVEACERMPQKSDKHLCLSINFEKNFLFISCRNSTGEVMMGSDESTFPTMKKEKEKHGYGMAAMEKIAEKYNSILKIELYPGEFSVKTNLFLDQKRKLNDN
ncbi:MAG: GHKL domain-containing protein [Clostridia bacterium]|nr:GHKL domain-containing protein [Clostridia bacterium]